MVHCSKFVVTRSRFASFFSRAKFLFSQPALPGLQTTFLQHRRSKFVVTVCRFRLNLQSGEYCCGSVNRWKKEGGPSVKAALVSILRKSLNGQPFLGRSVGVGIIFLPMLPLLTPVECLFPSSLSFTQYIFSPKTAVIVDTPQCV